MDFNQEVAMNGLILLAESGSSVLGTSIDETSDVDLQGITIESPGVLLGHRGFEQAIVHTGPDGTPVHKGERTPPGGEDRSIFSLRKWTAQAVKGNANFLMPLFVPASGLHQFNSYGIHLRNNYEMFLSKRAAYSFMGYLNRQKENAFQDNRHTNRPELVKLYGYDTKSAYHALRLAIQGKELMDNRWIEVPMLPVWQDYLKAVRRGQIPLAEVLEGLGILTTLLEESAQQTTLPDTVDMHLVDTWLTGMYVTYWKEHSWV